MKSRELYSIIIGFIIAVIVYRIMADDWHTVSILLIALIPFVQQLHTRINEDGKQD